MANLSPTDEEEFPSDQPDDPVQFILAQRRSTVANALTSLDDDPEQAARAEELSRKTGAPPALTFGNLEGFEQQHKAALTAQLLNNNRYLAEYADSHPLAAKVSNDDWGQLDTVSQAIEKFKGSRAGQILDAPASALAAAAKGFKEGAELDQPYLKSIPLDPDTNRLLWSVGSMVGGVGEIPSRFFSGLLEGFHQGAAQFLTSMGMESNAAELHARQATALLEAEAGGLTGRGHVGEPAEEAVAKTRIDSATQKLTEAAKLAQPYVEQGLEPPVGLHELIDQLHGEQTKLDGKNFDDAFKESQKSATRERSADLFAGFAEQHTDASIGINPDVVRELYGDKIPEAEDNLLGWVPRIQEQLAASAVDGGDIEVPVKDYWAKATPEVHEALREHIRYRPGGMTLEESKVPAAELVEDELPKPTPTPVDGVRQASGLLPMKLAEPAKAGAGSIIPEDVGPGTQVEAYGNTAGSAYHFLAKDAIQNLDAQHLTGVGRALFDFFGAKLKQMAGDTQVHVIDDADWKKFEAKSGYEMGGFYNIEANRISIPAALAEGRMGSGNASSVILHEVAHAATVKAIQEYPNVKSAISGMMKETHDFLMDADPASREKHDYAFTNEYEFVAEAMSNPHFQEVLASTPISEELSGKLGLGQKRSTAWDAVREIIKNLVEKLVGIRPTDSILDGMLRLGDVFEEAGKREKAKTEGGTLASKKPKEPKLPGITEEERKGYVRLIAQRDAEDREFQQKQIEKAEREKQTKEWKENFDRVRADTREDLRNRPDLAADHFLRTGELFGEKLAKAKLDKGALSDEQLRSLPPDLVGSDGIHPDQLASAVGYGSGDLLVSALARLEQERQLEGLTPAAHFSKLVDTETERKMRKDYGSLEENILREAQNQAVSPTTLKQLYMEAVIQGKDAHGEGAVAGLTEGWVKQAAREAFNAKTVGDISSKKLLAQMGSLDRKIQQALLDGDSKEAFRLRTQKVVAGHMAREAIALERHREQFDKLAKRYSVRPDVKTGAVGSVPGAYVNWIQDILMRTGGFVKRSVQDLNDAIGREPEATLKEFVDSHNIQLGLGDVDNPPIGLNMPVAQFLLDPEFRKEIEKMTPEEFDATHNSIKTIVKNGQDARKYTVRGEKADLAEVISGLVERLKAAVGGKKLMDTPDQRGSVMRQIGAWVLNPETWFERLDLGNRNGPFSQLITRKIVEGQYTLKTLEREYSKKFREIGDFPDQRKKIDNQLFRDPEGELIQLNRGNLYAILANMGNKEQRRKLAAGWGIDNPDKIFQWLFQHTEKEDWDRAQRMGEYFSEIFSKSEQMYHSLSGVAPARIELGEIQTPWGPMKEWYHPLIPDPLRHGAMKMSDMMDESGYYRPATQTGYTKRRTGATYPIDLSFDAIPSKIKAMLNDIAMHEPVTEVSKILLNKDFKNAFTAYYGKEYSKALEPWLRDAAGQSRYTPAGDAAINSVMNYVRENMATLLIGWNLGTVMKHFPTALMFSMREVGIGKFLDSFTYMIAHDTEEGQTRWSFAMDNSEELQNRLRSTKESLMASNADLFKAHNWDHKFFTMRDAIQTLGATPVAMSDFISAVPMWDAAYRKAIEAGKEHGDAVYDANTAVRRTHGSSIVTNRPAIMRMNPWVQTFMPFYNFFNNALQRNYEFAWKSKLALQGRELPEMTGFEKEQFQRGMKNIPHIMGGFLTFGVMVSMVEQAVDPLPQGKDENAVWHGAKVVARGPLSMFPILRDLVNATTTGGDPSGGLVGSFYRDITAPLSGKGKVSNPGRAIRQTNALLGALTGLTFDEIGKVGQYTYNVTHGREHPESLWDYYRAIRHGTQKERK